MIQGLYAAANGMMAVEDRQAVIANNIANVTTPGFKRQFAVQRGYYDAFSAKTRRTSHFDFDTAPGGGIKTIETFTNFGDGIVSHTGAPLDIALVGPGFLSIDTPDGQRFTRNGHLSIGVSGELVTAQGHPVLDEGGAPIDATGGIVEIDGAGTVKVNGAARAQIALVEFQNRAGLTREGYSLYSAPQSEIDQATRGQQTVVSPGAVETSNVQLPSEVAQMMIALRAYAANQKVITVIDETAGRLIDQVGAPS